ncbi:MAG: alpha/beta fold hydrolase, partial [Halobacteriovoraceae bacterium]|nr:alpha/beta fold hydrolase [Halobacteriovoraceae bacterium]
NYQQHYCIAHSMGTIVGLLFAQKHPRFFSGMVLNAPMLQLRLDDFPEKFIKSIFTFYKLMGKGKDYVINGGPAIHNLPWEKNRVTRSQERWEFSRHIELTYPELEMGASTFNWVLEALYAGEKCFRRRKRLKNMPILMFQAGNDWYVKKERQDKFCDDLEHCRSIFYEDAYHEIFQEKDEIRNEVIEEIKWFFKNHP